MESQDPQKLPQAPLLIVTMNLKEMQQGWALKELEENTVLLI